MLYNNRNYAESGTNKFFNGTVAGIEYERDDDNEDFTPFEGKKSNKANANKKIVWSLQYYYEKPWKYTGEWNKIEGEYNE